MELAFLVDSSTKSSSNAWTQMLSFVSEVVRRYNINPNCVRATVIRYSSSADVQIQLNQYSDANNLAQAIGRIPFLGGSSNLAAALNLLQSQAFASNIVRSGATRIVIIVTDQLQPSTAITDAANSVKSQGILIVAVGITGPGRLNTNIMYDIVSNRWAVPVSDYSQLVSGATNTIVQQYACTSAPIPQPPGPAASKCIYIL